MSRKYMERFMSGNNFVIGKNLREYLVARQDNTYVAPKVVMKPIPLAGGGGPLRNLRNQKS